MFSDTHFHFHNIVTERAMNGADILSHMAARNCFFGLDIGTRCNDLEPRQKAVEESISQITDPKLAEKARNFIHYSAGIWPDIEAIKNCFEDMKILREKISSSKTKIIAIGEGGIDHHWNPSGVDAHSADNYTAEIFHREHELFEMQLELAKEMDLPYIVHSRDGFEDTLDCIKNVGWNKGIIHCYSYGLKEAEAFLNLGWYISFSGSVTYTKKAKMEEMHQLLNIVPSDRILCETDAPYLAPVPFRGQTNTPVLVDNTYRFVAEHRNVTAEELSETVDTNIRKLFSI